MDLENLQTAPTLTFDMPVENEIEIVPPQVPVAESLSETTLSPQEQQMVNEFALKIDLNNSNAVLQYGAATQKKMADFSETALENVKTKDLGEIGDMLSSVVTELKSFDVSGEESKGIAGLFKKSSNKLTAMRSKYDKAEVNITKIVSALEGHQRQLLKDVAILDKMYDLNLTYYKELTMYIMAGKQKLADTRTKLLTELVEKARISGLPEDAQAAKDLEGRCDRFEKKIHDLDLTRTISMQTAPQIRMVQGNDTMMAEKIQSTIVNTIPLWKSQMVIALGVAHAAQATKAQNQVTDMTNELLRKNADNLKIATVDTAKASERAIVDIETLKHTNETLISTLDEVMKIQADGRAKRKAAETELHLIENQLKAKMLEMAGGK